jgi:hypothetical protein
MDMAFLRWFTIAANRAIAATIIILVTRAASYPNLAIAQQDQPASSGVNVVTRFAGVLSVPRRGTSTLLHVQVQDWYVAGKGRTIKLPSERFYLAILQSGRVISQIGGKSEVRIAGDFWPVDAGVVMTIQIMGQGALLEILAASP